MLEGLAIVFIPMFLGYLIKLKDLNKLKLIDQALMIFLYIIIVLMGYNIGIIDKILVKLPAIGLEAVSLLVLLLVCNIIILAFIEAKITKNKTNKQDQITKASENSGDDLKKQIIASLKIILLVILGFIIGFYTKNYTKLHSETSTIFLVVLIFLVGISLRNSGLKLKEVFLNKQGVIGAVIFMFSCLLAGILFALIFNYKTSIGLTLASGFGWYSFSSIFVSKELGAVLGSIAFFNDFLRELLAFILIPIFILKFPATAISIGGATSMDCALPVISKSGGIKAIPIALSFGLIVNIFTPLLMGFFINIYKLGWF